MATTTSITTTYAGTVAGDIIGTALLAGTTLGNNGITIKQNIKYKEVLRKISLGDLVKDATCDFDATGNVTQTEVYIEPKKFDVNKVLCKDDWTNDWAGAEMSMSEWDELPKTVGDFIIARMIAKIGQKNENTIWTGVDATDGEYDGFEVLLTTNADQPTNMEISGSTLSAANIQAQMSLVIDQIPATLYGDPNLMLYIPLSAYKFYVQALAGFGASGLGAAGVNALGQTAKHDINNIYFNGVKLFVANGMSADTMVCTLKENLVFGTGLMEDFNKVKVLDMEDVDLSSNVRFAARYSATVMYQFGEEIVTYGITNTSN